MNKSLPDPLYHLQSTLAVDDEELELVGRSCRLGATQRQRALGHKNVSSTVSYLSFLEEEIDEAILAL